MTPNRGKYVLLAFALVLALGIIGSYQQDPQAFTSEPADYLYRILQLFTLEGDWTSEKDLNILLEIVRFSAPIVTLGSLIILFAEDMWTLLVNAQIRMFKNHIIVVGASSSAMVLIRDCNAHGLKVVVIENSPENPHLAECRSARVPVLVGDTLSETLLLRANVHSAKVLLSFVDNDDHNVELSLRIQEIVNDQRSSQSNPLKVILQVQDMQLGSRLETYPKFFEVPQKMEVQFFNTEELAARSLFQDYAPDIHADALGTASVHLVVLGYGRLGRHVLMASLRQAHYPADKLLNITVLAP